MPALRLAREDCEGIAMSPEVHAFLERREAVYALHEHRPIVSFDDARAALPFDPAAMVKSLAFRLPGGGYAVAALRAAERADYKKISEAFGVRRADLALAGPDDVEEALGMVPGGVCPLPINGARVVVDEAVPAMAVVFCGTGRSDTTMEIAGAELLRVAGAAVAPLSK
ncbi:hypothetical protein CDO44_08390 [Pigmentiphaga sp. NML080357]|nr:hypothetical protein CDO44_08390 [Pigmentiphaga sp. NML080357]